MEAGVIRKLHGSCNDEKSCMSPAINRRLHEGYGTRKLHGSCNDE